MSFSGRLWQEIVAWSRTDGLGWMFVLKTTLAVLLAMGISMRLDLGQPVTAMVTVYIIMHPQTGMVLTKSLYRVFGTFAGACASLVLLGLFAQQRVLFLCGLALWIGLCGTGAAFYRNFRSYGFTLAGYTAALICFPLVMNPTNFFDYAVSRLTEVVVGIICAAVVSEVLFPRSLSDGIVKALELRYSQFTGFARDVLAENMSSQEIERMHLQFAANVVATEAQRGSVLMEASEMRAYNSHLRQLNSRFMEMSTTFHSLSQLLTRLKRVDMQASKALAPLTLLLAEVVAPAEKSAAGAEIALRAEQGIAEFRDMLTEREDRVRERYRDSSGGDLTLDLETALELIQRFAEELHEYSRTYTTLTQSPVTKVVRATRFVQSTDPVLAALVGVRAVAVVFLMAAFWIASAWPYGAYAVMMAATVTVLFAAAPDPALAVSTGIFGALIGFIAAFVCKFSVLTAVPDIWLLMVCLAPFLMVGSLLALNPKLTVVGIGYSVMFCFMVAPANRMVYDPVNFANFGSALIIGVASAAIILATFSPVTGRWVKRRTARMLRKHVESACSRKLSQFDLRLESGTRDLLQRLSAQSKLKDPHEREILGWFFVALEIGRAVIDLRKSAASVPLPQPLSAGIRETLKLIARHFESPTAQNYSDAYSAVEYVAEAIKLESDQEGVCRETREGLRRMLTSLHFIRSSLLDEESILMSGASGPLRLLQGEVSYAA